MKLLTPADLHTSIEHRSRPCYSIAQMDAVFMQESLMFRPGIGDKVIEVAASANRPRYFMTPPLSSQLLRRR